MAKLATLTIKVTINKAKQFYCPEGQEYKYLELTFRHQRTGERKKNGIRKKAEKMYEIINGKTNRRAN